MYKHINWHCKERELGTKLASSHSQNRGEVEIGERVGVRVK